jgi:hypothetical protein
MYLLAAALLLQCMHVHLLRGLQTASMSKLALFEPFSRVMRCSGLWSGHCCMVMRCSGLWSGHCCMVMRCSGLWSGHCCICIECQPCVSKCGCCHGLKLANAPRLLMLALCLLLTGHSSDQVALHGCVAAASVSSVIRNNGSVQGSCFCRIAFMMALRT